MGGGRACEGGWYRLELPIPVNAFGRRSLGAGESFDREHPYSLCAAMTPTARLAAAIEMLTEMEADRRPADMVASAFLKSRRYIGSKDRKAISERVWGCLRRRARLDWWLLHLGVEPWPRARLLADLVLNDRLTPEQVGTLFSGAGHGPGGLVPEERAMLQSLKGRDLFHHDMPAWVRGEYPAWLEPALASVFGDRLAAEMGAMRDEAPVDLRVNTLVTGRDEARARLIADGLAPMPTPLSPIGLRLPARTQLAVQTAFREGLVEVQDEGSQLVSLLVDAGPGQAVCDYCAGAGGKTLALAAAMENKGRLLALDINAARSERSAERLRRAGVHNVTRRLLGSANDRWIKRQAGTFDRVLVDAPCSGSGTWRRNPDAKWRLTPERVAELATLQASILDDACRLVKPGGRLIYVTCSLLAEENHQQMAHFLERHPSFSLLPVASVWETICGVPYPGDGDTLRLTPASQGTDGFFCAVLLRAAAPAAQQPGDQGHDE